jgi:hypothetical protein
MAIKIPAPVGQDYKPEVPSADALAGVAIGERSERVDNRVIHTDVPGLEVQGHG